MIKNTITYLLGLALLGLSGFTISEQIQNVMSCTIKSIQVTDIVDGKVKTYTGYKEGLEVGDSVQMNITLDKEICSLDVKMTDEPSNVNWLYDRFYLPLDIRQDDITTISMTGSDKYSGYNQSYGELRLSRIAIIGNGHHFERYFKDDWMGITTRLLRTETKIYQDTYTLDCKHRGPSKIDEIYDFVAKVRELGVQSLGNLCLIPDLKEAKTIGELILEQMKN